MDTETNWARLGRAVEYYKALGYKYVELPWTVPNNIMTATCDESMIINSDIGPLVGSAEQSFLAAEFAGELGYDKFVSCTPCFRVDEVDDLHSTTFMKVELYQNTNIEWGASGMMLEALDFFKSEGAIRPIIVTTAEGSDIEVNDIEVGSYGVRGYKYRDWIYGTGLAEPRFSKAIQMGM